MLLSNGKALSPDYGLVGRLSVIHVLMQLTTELEARTYH